MCVCRWMCVCGPGASDATGSVTVMAVGMRVSLTAAAAVEDSGDWTGAAATVGRGFDGGRGERCGDTDRVDLAASAAVGVARVVEEVGVSAIRSGLGSVGPTILGSGHGVGLN